MNLKLRRWSLLAGPAARLTRLHPARSGDGGTWLAAAASRTDRESCVGNCHALLCEVVAE